MDECLKFRSTLVFPIFTCYNYIFILFQYCQEFLLFIILIFEDDIKGDPFDSCCLKLLNQQAVLDFWYIEHLESAFCLKRIDTCVVDTNYRNIVRGPDGMRIYTILPGIVPSPIDESPIEDISIFFWDEKASEYDRKCEDYYNKNMFEFLEFLHTIDSIINFTSMQKIAMSQIFSEEILRAVIFSVSFFAIMLSGFVGMAYAATDGGYFGILLNKILVTAWDEPTNDGTVRNANNLGGQAANTYVPVGTNRSCGSNQCIYGFDASGDVQCR